MDECEFSLEKLSCFFLAPSRVEMGFNSPFPDVGDSFQAHCRVPAPPPTRVSVTSEIGRLLLATLRLLALNSSPDLKSRRLRLPYSHFPILLCYGSTPLEVPPHPQTDTGRTEGGAAGSGSARSESAPYRSRMSRTPQCAPV
jgi:hypothetical protein